MQCNLDNAGISVSQTEGVKFYIYTDFTTSAASGVQGITYKLFDFLKQPNDIILCYYRVLLSTIFHLPPSSKSSKFIKFILSQNYITELISAKINV